MLEYSNAIPAPTRSWKRSVSRFSFATNPARFASVGQPPDWLRSIWPDLTAPDATLAD